MATSVETIYNWLASRVAQQEGLAGLSPANDNAASLTSALSSGSRVAIWRLLLWAVAYVHRAQEVNFDRYRQEVYDMALNGQFGTRRWFVSKALEFQIGHVLEFTPLDARYPVIDESARIVSHAAVVELANTVIVKVAKTAGNGLVKLANEELVAVNDYFQRLRPPVQVAVLTADPDKLRIIGAVVCDGQYVIPGIVAAVEFAVSQYLRSLAFGGVVRVTDLRTIILGVDGVVDVRIESVHVRTTGDWVPVPRVHYTYAGHAVIDPGEPLSSSMQFAIGVV